MNVVHLTQAIEKIPIEEIKEIPRFCYRKKLQGLGKYSSDKGWGCTFRSFQSILAIFIHKLQLAFPSIVQDKFGVNENYLSLFYDDPTKPFSIQKLTHTATKYGVEIGQWAKPSQLSAVAKEIFEEFQINVLIPIGLTISPTEIQESKYPLLFLINIMVGQEKFEIAYLDFFKSCISNVNCLGFVSGYKGKSYYMSGFKDDHFLYYDPHVTKKAALCQEDILTFFQEKHSQIPSDKINPSCVIGFCLEDMESFQSLINEFQTLQSLPLLISDTTETDNDYGVIELDD